MSPIVVYGCNVQSRVHILQRKICDGEVTEDLVPADSAHEIKTSEYIIANFFIAAMAAMYGLGLWVWSRLSRNNSFPDWMRGIWLHIDICGLTLSNELAYRKFVCVCVCVCDRPFVWGMHVCLFVCL